ncbi:MAG: DUF1232 domain-containing protein [Thermomicrobiales bacterium]
MTNRISRIRSGFIGIATEIYALTLALRDPHASWAARIAAIFFALYVVNPIDIIPEAVPFLGIADDALAIPLAYFVISKMLPAQLLESANRAAAETDVGRKLWKIFLIALGLLSIVWIIAFVGLGITIWRALN